MTLEIGYSKEKGDKKPADDPPVYTIIRDSKYNLIRAQTKYTHKMPDK